MSTVVVLTGGGMKGAVAAARCAADNELILVHIDYGQPSAPAELGAVRAFSATLSSASVMAIPLTHLATLHAHPPGPGDSPSKPEEVGDATAAPSAAVLRGLMPVLLSVGSQCALSVGASSVVTGLSRLCYVEHVGLSGGDATGARQRDLIHSFNLMIENLSAPQRPMRVEAPLLDLPMTQIVKLAKRFRVSAENTWTCQRSRPRPCGGCEPCKQRAVAFAQAGMADPLVNPIAVPT